MLLTSAKAALAFTLGGCAIFTIKKPATGGRFTFKVTIPRDKTPETTTLYFVSVLRGPENATDYTYIGVIRCVHGRWYFTHGTKSKISINAPCITVFNFVFNNLVQGQLSTKLEFWHEGKCARCGRKLTVPESIASGFGPECIKQTVLK